MLTIFAGFWLLLGVTGTSVLFFVLMVRSGVIRFGRAQVEALPSDEGPQ